MNCATFQQRLLSAEHPDQLTARMTRHAAECASCRLLHHRLIALERQLPRIPVPATTAGAALVHRLWAGEVMIPPDDGSIPVFELPSSTPSPGPAPNVPASESANGFTDFASLPPPRTPLGTAAAPRTGPWAWMDSMRERGLRKLAAALALAASLLVFAAVWWAWPHHRVDQRVTLNPLAARQAERDRLLAAAHTPSERVQVLVELADRLQREALTLARRADGENLRVVARFYGQVVREDLISHARTVPRADRRSTLNDAVQRLQWTESELQRLISAEQQKVPDSLREIATAAGEGHKLLCELVDEAV
jgi:hypothetical protein